MREPHYRGVPPGALPPLVRNPAHVVLDNLRSAFNVGSIFRTADAAAVERIHLCGHTAHPPNKKLEKTALGALDYVPWTYHPDAFTAIRALQHEGIPCIAVEVAANAIFHTSLEWPKPVAVVFGNEVVGISPEALRHCDGVVRIPMRGYKNTINVATAFGVIVYEILRQWDNCETVPVTEASVRP
jgi:tRNA G18 (ribose-2'-O)-methylase SpoU